MLKFLLIPLLAWLTLPAAAQTYPDRALTLIVPFAANGPTDTIARTLATAMGKQLKQSVVVENVAGAGGTVAASQVARADPDGYTLLMYHIGMATAPALYRKLSFEPLRDFEPLGEVTDVPMTLIARADFPAKDLKETLAYLRSHRDTRIAHAGLGSASHLCGLLFQSSIEVDLKTVSYKGTGPAMNDILAGKVDLVCDQTTNSTPHIRAGTVRALGVTSPRRVTSLPEVPPLQDASMKPFELAIWHALYVPRGTPKPVIDRLVAALQAALQDPAVKIRFADLGTEPVPQDRATPKAARDHLTSELARWGPIIKKAGEYAD